MTEDRQPLGTQRVRRIPARVPARVGGTANLRAVARAMVDSGVGAVLVETPAGPVGLVTAGALVEAVAGGADPDIVWAGDIARPAPRVVSCEQHPAEIGNEMAAYRLEVVAVVDDDAPVAVASALDILEAVLRTDAQVPDAEL